MGFTKHTDSNGIVWGTLSAKLQSEDVRRSCHSGLPLIHDANASGYKHRMR
jgi:hypothetical protein